MKTLEAIDDSIWLAEGEIVDFYSFAYPTRALILRLSDGGLWIWSPVKLSQALRQEVDRLGPVAHLVSPNKLHHLYLAEWSAVYPDAKLWGPASTVSRHPELSFCAPLESEPPQDWRGDIDQAWFRGSPLLDEIIFFHRASKTVIVADLIQALGDDFLRAQWRWWQRPLARLDGIGASKPGAPREWRLSFFDRAPARAACAKMFAWDCERVVMAHGEWRRSGGAAFLRRSFAWVGA